MSSENTQKKKGGPDRSVSNNQSSSVTLDEMEMKPVTVTLFTLNPCSSWHMRNIQYLNTETACVGKYNKSPTKCKTCNFKLIYINPNEVQII